VSKATTFLRPAEAIARYVVVGGIDLAIMAHTVPFVTYSLLPGDFEGIVEKFAPRCWDILNL